jgi:serine/threonine protein kinase
MPLLNSDLTILANPPSFETCSRDVYPVDTSLTAAQVKHITNGVASAMLHLHAQGLVHGDLYAHNILWNDEQVVLSDLGGASFLPLQDKAMTAALEKLDVRAYHVLIEELTQLIP